MTPDDIDVMARTVWGEARGEDLGGKVAVAWVIKNRVDNPKWWGTDISSVCQKAWQFSCWNADDPNRSKLMYVTTQDGPFQDCLLAAAGVISRNFPDPTQGATHYKVSSLAWPKDWGPQKDPLVTLGNHSFYKI